MNYLYGDSTESNLDFNYLAFLREVIDCAVVMAESEVALATTVERRRVLDKDTSAVIAAVDELGKRATELVGPIAKDQGATPVGRCAASIATAISAAVERESTQLKAKLATERDEIDKVDHKLRARAKDILDKMLRTHDLPGAEKDLEITWTNSGVKAMMRQKTSFGVEAVLSLDIPPGSLFVPDLRVDRISEGVEVHAVEAGGWLKKSDKLVPHKLGRYQVARVTVGNVVSVRLRSGPDANSPGFEVKVHKKGEITIEPFGDGPARELTIDDRDRPKLQMLVERVEAAARLLELRTGLVSIDIDGKPFAEHPHPRVLAEKMIAACAPTVQRIVKHSRSPGELVLRRLIGDNRREELFVSTAELVQKYEKLPATVRDVFAPLQLAGEPAPEVKPAPVEARVPEPIRPTPAPEAPSQPHRSSPSVPVPEARGTPRTAPPPMPEGRRTGKTSPPPISAASAQVAMPDKPRSVTVPTHVPAIAQPSGPTKTHAEPDESKQVTRPAAVIVDTDSDDDGAQPPKN
jgi:hypothetical protein